MRKITIIFILIILATNLTSCYDANEIDAMLHVIAIGIDKGITDKWRITFQFPTMQEPGGGNGNSDSSDGGQNEYAHVTIDAPTFFTGIDMLNASLPRRLIFSHTQFIAFSDELAKSGLIKEYIAPINRFREIRRTAHVLVVKGSANEFLKENQPFVGNLASKGFEILLKESNNTGFFPHVTLEDFYSSLKSSYHQPIATLAATNDFKSFQKEGSPWGTKFNTGGNYMAGDLPRTGGNKIELFGTALFNGSTMVGKLNGDESRYMLMVRNEFKRSFFTMKDPKNPELAIPLDIRGPTRPKIRVSFDGTKPVIDLTINLNADILAIQSYIDYKKPELKSLLEGELQGVIEDGIKKTIQKCQRLNTDVFAFGNYASKNFLTIGDLENYNWNSHFKDAKVRVDVKIAIRRTGTQIHNAPIKNSEGDE